MVVVLVVLTVANVAGAVVATIRTIIAGIKYRSGTDFRFMFAESETSA